MPDEQSNLNLPAAARRPAGRRRGRRGGRGRSPRPAAGKTSAPAATEEIPPAFPEPETTGETAVHAEHAEAAEHEADTSGDFREPHPEENLEEHAETAPPEESHRAR